MCLQNTAKARRAIQQSNQGHRPWIGNATDKKACKAVPATI